MFRQQDNIALPLGQGRQHNGKHGQTVIEVLPEDPLPHQGFQIVTGCDHEPDIRLDGIDAPRTGKFPILNKTQQFDLCLHAQFADLIQKDGTAIQFLQQTVPAGICSGKGVFLVAEEFVLHQIRRHGGTVQRSKRFLFAGRKIHDRPCGKLFACSRSAADHHNGIGGRHLPDLGSDLLHGAAVADESTGIGGQHGAQFLVFFQQFLVFFQFFLPDANGIGGQVADNFQ